MRPHIVIGRANATAVLCGSNDRADRPGKDSRMTGGLHEEGPHHYVHDDPHLLGTVASWRRTTPTEEAL